MSDRYIDYDETQFYGPYASKKIHTVCVGLLAAFDPGLTYVAEAIDKATAAVAAALAGSRKAGAGIRDGATDRKPALAAALDLLGRFSSHLDSHKKGVIDRKVFFTDDGTLAPIGQGTARVLLALSHLSLELAKPDSLVNEKETWAAEVMEAIASLTAVADHADSSETDQRDITPALQAARQAWLQSYAAAKDEVRAVLRSAGKLGLMRSVFNDLAQPAAAKVTKMPEDQPPAT